MPEKEPSPWLRELQQKSWEPEILLSGIVLYGMFQIPDLLDEFLVFFKSNILRSFGDIETAFNILKAGVYWLITGLIIHLFCRGIWIGFVGLSYAFPESVRTENLPYKGRFLTKVKAIPSLEKIVDRLEKICSSIFSTSFMFFMTVLGGYCFIFFLLALPYMTLVLSGVENDSTTMWLYRNIYTYPIATIMLISFFDFLSLGALKRIKFIEPVYWPIHRFVSVVTLSRFYRNIYYAIASNTNKWALRFLLFLFTGCSLILTTAAGQKASSLSWLSRLDLWKDSHLYGIMDDYYDNMSEGVPSSTVSIPSDIISGNTVRLFIAADVHFQDLIKETTNYDSLRKVSEVTKTRLNLQVVSDYYHIYLGDSLISDREFFYHYKAKTNQKGYLTYLDVRSLPTGLHQLSVGPPPKDGKIRKWSIINFYRE